MNDYLSNLDPANLVNVVKQLVQDVAELKGRTVNVNSLEEFSTDLGTMLSGEFRSGNGVEPGSGFTGGRFGYPGFEYGGRLWFLVGVNNDVMMVGLDLTTGEITAGGGTVKLNDDGVSIMEGSAGGMVGQYQPNSVTFVDTDGVPKAEVNEYLSGSSGYRILKIGAVVASDLLNRGEILIQVETSTGSERVWLRLNGVTQNVELANGLQVYGGIDIEAGSTYNINGVPHTHGDIDSIPEADHTAHGIKATFTAHDAQVFGDVCFINADGEMAIADADAIASAVVVGMCADASISASAVGNYLLMGIARDDSWNWTPGGFVYLSLTGTTGNTLTETAPSGADDCIVIVGVAAHADRMVFNPQLVIVEHV